MRSSLACVVLIALLMSAASPAVASSGVVAFRTPQSGRLRASEHAHARFDLPPGFRQAYGALSGALADGAYRRESRLPSGRTCTLMLMTGAIARPAPPAVRGGRVRSENRGTWLAYDAIGDQGSRRWYAGRVGDALFGIGAQPVPTWARAGRPWALFTAEVSGAADSRSRADRRACKAAKHRLVPAVRRSIASMRLVRGALPSLRVLPGVPAPAGAMPGSRVAQGPGGVRLLVPPTTVSCPESGNADLVLGVQVPNPSRSRVRMVRAKALGPGGDVRGGPIWRTADAGPSWRLRRLGLGACGRTVRWFYLVGLGEARATPPARIDLTATVRPATTS